MESENIKIANVRLSFPSLYRHESFNGENSGKYAATLLLHKKTNKEAIKVIANEIKELVSGAYKSGKRPTGSKICLRDGDAEECSRDEYAGHYYIKASNSNRVSLKDRDRNPAAEEDEIFYAGCYVNAIISLWSQDNQFGRRINANLKGLMFCEHGEPFGTPPLDDDEFDAFGNEGDEEYMNF